jgi:hypothetical protein
LELVTLPGEPPEACPVFQWVVNVLDWQRP